VATRSDRLGTRGHRPAPSGAGEVDDYVTGVVPQLPPRNPYVPDPSDTRHLRTFTQTAQVPVVPGPAGYRVDPRFLNTGQVPVYQRRKVPLGLRVAVWLVALLLLVAVAGVVVHQVRPAWLHRLEVASGASAPTRSSAGSTTGTGASHPTSSTPSGSTRSSAPAPGTTTLKSPNGVVVADVTNPAAVTVKVAASKFTVVLLAHGSAWVSVTVPGHSAPIFAQVVPAGADTFDSLKGGVTLEIGASPVVLEVQVNGKTVPGWQFVPKAAPFTISFASASAKH